MVERVERTNDNNQSGRSNQKRSIFTVLLSVEEQRDDRHRGEQPHNDGLHMRIDADGRQAEDRRDQTERGRPKADRERNGGAGIGEEAKTKDATM